MRSRFQVWRDVWFPCGVAAVSAFLVSCFAASLVPLRVRQVMDVWFGGDLLRAMANMSDPLSHHARTSVHPIASLLLLPVVRPPMELGVPRQYVVTVVIALCGALTAALIVHAQIRLGVRPVDALLLIGVFVSSGSFLFWWSIPETFPVAALTIALPFWLLALGSANHLAWVLAVTATLSITTTNLAAGVLCTWFSPQRRHIGRILASAVALVFLLSVIQQSYLPTARFFWMPASVLAERGFTQPRNLLGAAASLPRLADFVVHAGVVPARPMIRGGTLSYLQDAGSGVTGLRRLPAVAWFLLLLSGLPMLARPGRHRPLAAALGLFLLAQLGLHMVYGDFPFLYSAHALPAMVLWMALALTPAAPRWLTGTTRALALVFVLFALPLNLESFRRAIEVATALAGST